MTKVMGIFSRMVNYMTGGSAEVKVDIEKANLSAPFPVRISANILHDNLEAEKVYVLVRCTEKKKEDYTKGKSALTDNEKILKEMNDWDSETIYKSEIQVAPRTRLEKGKEYSWEIKLDLSQQDKPSLNTENHRVIWEIQGALDVAGNDPDSGWVEFKVAN